MINEKGDTVVCIREESEVQFSKSFPSWVHSLKKDQIRDTIMELSNQEFIEDNPKENPEILDNVYRTLLDCTVLSDAHYDHLTSPTRQMSDKEVYTRQYRSFPLKPWKTVHEIRRMLGIDDFKGIPGFFQNEYGWSISGTEGILIPYRNQYNQIIGYQTRIDNPPPDLEIKLGSIKGLKAQIKEYPLAQILVNDVIIEEVEIPLGKTHSVYHDGGYGFVKMVKGQRYFWLSSANKKNGTGAGNPLPVHVSIPTKELEFWEKGKIRKASSVWITEGALKADIAAEHITKVYAEKELEEIGSTILAIPGVNTWRSVIPLLKTMDTKHINIAFDMDAMENPKVAFHLKQLALELKNNGFTANVVLWNPEDGKGIDDVLINRRSPTLKKLF